MCAFQFKPYLRHKQTAGEILRNEGNFGADKHLRDTSALTNTFLKIRLNNKFFAKTVIVSGRPQFKCEEYRLSFCLWVECSQSDRCRYSPTQGWYSTRIATQSATSSATLKKGNVNTQGFEYMWSDFIISEWNVFYLCLYRQLIKHA